MTRRRLLLALGVGLAMLALLAGLPFALPMKSGMEAKYDRIQPGMTEEEVEAILGPPFDDGDYGGTGGGGALWWDERGPGEGWTIVLVGYEEGRVTEKKLERRAGKGWLQELRARFGW